MRSDHAQIAGRGNARPATTEHEPAGRSKAPNRVFATDLDQPEEPAMLDDGTHAIRPDRPEMLVTELELGTVEIVEIAAPALRLHTPRIGA